MTWKQFDLFDSETTIVFITGLEETKEVCQTLAYRRDYFYR